MKLISWNVNGIRAVYKKGLIEFIEREDPDVICLQEVKAHIEQCEPVLRAPAGRIAHWLSAQRKGYSGVATFSKVEPQEARHSIGIAAYDAEGRIVITKHQDFTLYNIYFPNGGSGEERHQFKQQFLRDLDVHLKPLVAKGEKIVVVGDYNVAHADIDVYNPSGLAGESGFLPEEREWFGRFLDLGFVDSFRYLHPDAKERFSWWAYYERGRTGNRGWRIDYICVTKNLVDRIVRADIMENITGSDHCPVVLEMTDV